MTGRLRPLLAGAAGALVLLTVPGTALADALTGDVERQAVNIPAIVMFMIFVIGTLGITYWAARRT